MTTTRIIKGEGMKAKTCKEIQDEYDVYWLAYRASLIETARRDFPVGAKVKWKPKGKDYSYGVVVGEFDLLRNCVKVQNSVTKKERIIEVYNLENAEGY